jgi:hypothetical protein
MAELSDDEILEELGLDATPKKESKHSHEQARVFAGFEDIVRFVDEHGCKPEHGEDRDIFERLYAVRLDRIRGNPTYRALVADLDKHGLLAGAADDIQGELEDVDDDALLEELGLASEAEDSITQLKYVKPRAEVHAAEEVASRQPCKDFAHFKPLFAEVQTDLDTGRRETRRLKAPDEDASDEIKLDEIKPGTFFVVGGQIAYIAASSDEMRTRYDRRDARLRVIYDNGTEADLLMRSFQRSLHRDPSARVITDLSAGPLFAGTVDESDTESGTIYVLRSASDHPLIAESREFVHKIGVTGGEVSKRLTGAKDDPTYLFADVEIVATYKLYNINRSKLENLLHRIFAPARLDLQMDDRFGRPVKPREWFLVPLSVIDEVVSKVKDQTITEFSYDPQSASLVTRSRSSVR